MEIFSQTSRRLIMWRMPSGRVSLFHLNIRYHLMATKLYSEFLARAKTIRFQRVLFDGLGPDSIKIPAAARGNASS